MDRYDRFGWTMSAPMTPNTPLTPLTPMTPMTPLTPMTSMSDLSADDRLLTSSAPTSAGPAVKVEWPFAIGSMDMGFDTPDGPTVQTVYSNSGSAGLIKGQLCGLEEPDPALGPLERLQRKWGIGDRKTRDGQPAKRRGPKPDSKPAMTRRQELNRQAQRTHRERKENYMRDLEINLDRIKALYAENVEKVQEENRKLKDILAAHGIPYDVSSTPGQTSFASPSSIIGSGTGSVGGFGSQASAFGSPPPHGSLSAGRPSPSFQAQQGSLIPSRNNVHGLNYEDVGLDFVHAYERNPYLSPPPN